MKLTVKRSRLRELVARCLRELCVSFVVGGLPLLLQSRNPKQVDEAVNALLAPEFLMSYYLYLVIAFGFISIVYLYLRSASEEAQHWITATHKFMTEVGCGFLTAIRMGLGATIGFLIWVFATQQAYLGKDVAALTAWVCFGIAASVCLAYIDEKLRNPKEAVAEARRRA
ncbi:hypothetical protein [Pseudomonas sp. PSE14]|uniref:hypothetical protein n=1 Tax=Pseudomonas sp. PSE14 TaxID=3016341 RepID=UPI0023D8C417|nr:hypothetical protein [Pseudomonas sp. PSE14]WEJ70320.1 hypothetical protein O6P39_16750 [Pseudomonas sp. PSE14]